MTEQQQIGQLATMLAGYDVVDLTVPLAENLPGSWPSHMQFQRKIYNWYADQDDPQQPRFGSRGPYYTAFLTIDEHCGTHIDAPCHFIPPPDSGLPMASEWGNVTVDMLDLGQLMGPAAVIDVTDLKDTGEGGVSPEITDEHVNRFEREHGDLQQGDIVLFRSDWDEHYLPPPEGSKYAFDSFQRTDWPGWPSASVECLEYIYNKGVMVAGLDGVSIGGMPNPVPPHHFGLGHGMLFIELLANLKNVPPRGAWFIYLPLKIKGGSAGPGRAIALVPKGAN